MPPVLVPTWSCKSALDKITWKVEQDVQLSPRLYEQLSNLLDIYTSWNSAAHETETNSNKITTKLVVLLCAYLENLLMKHGIS
jgi:hypothetical protein